MDREEIDILRSWHVNALPWTTAVRSQRILSRRLVTDRAIVDAVVGVAPRRVLDVGCGEGWLARALHSDGLDVLGVDAVPELITAATRQGGGEFAVASYGEIVAGNLDCGSCDAAVCNFSLLGRESVFELLRALGSTLAAPAHLIVQTLHPWAACGDQSYRDGWRKGHWDGFDADFSDPAPWFFRTLASWYTMLRQVGFDLIECREPSVAEAAAPSSIIFVCRRDATEIFP